MSSLHLALRFPDDLAEQRFRTQLRKRRNRLWLCMEAVRVCAWLIAALKASATAAPALAGGAATSALLVGLCSLPSRRLPLRLLYTAVVTVNLVQAAVGIGTHETLYPYSPAGSLAATHLRALLLSVLGNGVVWLIFYSTFTPLPFRWQLPHLVAVAAMLVWRTPTVCINANMQHGAVALHSAMQLALPVLVPAAAVRSARPAALAAPSPTAQRLCSVYQPAVLLLGLVAVCASLFVAERQQRQAVLAQQAAEGEAQAAEAAVAPSSRLPSGSPEAAPLAGAHMPGSGGGRGALPGVSPHVAAAAVALTQRAQRQARGHGAGQQQQEEEAPAGAGGDWLARGLCLLGIMLPVAAFLLAYVATWPRQQP